MSDPPASPWRLVGQRSEADAMAMLYRPEGDVALKVTENADLAVIAGALEGVLAHRGAADQMVVLPDAMTRVAFLLGQMSDWSAARDTRVAVEDARGAEGQDSEAEDPALPRADDALAGTAGLQPDRGPGPGGTESRASASTTSFRQALHELRKIASWYGATDRRVVAAREELETRADAPPDVAQRTTRAVDEGLRIQRALLEVERLANTRGANAQVVAQRIEALGQELGGSFVYAARRKVAKVQAMQSRGRQARASTVGPSSVDHRIALLAPARRWTLAVDEGGDIPERLGDTVRGPAGRFVGLLVPDGVTLPPLAPGWHAVEQPDHGSIDAVVQTVLDAPVGVLGITLAVLPQSTGDAWISGVLELVHWVCQLLPLEEAETELSVEVEQRGSWVDGPAWAAMATVIVRALEAHDPARARRLTVSLRLVSKKQARHGGYVDALAFTWSSPHGASRARLSQSGLLGTCLVEGDAVALRGVREAVLRGEAIPTASWRTLVRNPEAHVAGSFLSGILDALRARVRQDPAQWHRWMDGVRAHLDSKSVHLGALGRDVAFLSSCAPAGTQLPPPVRLAWLTAQLEAANHAGILDSHLEGELDALAAALFEEEPTLACQADLDRAVLATNRLDPLAASAALARWINLPPAVPGLRHWGRVRSSLGQHAALRRDPAGALAHFDEALGAFARLADGGVPERTQTSTYAAIAATDHSGLDVAAVRARIAALLPGGLTPECVAAIAVDASPGGRYVHHALVRWISRRGDAEARAAYLSVRDGWAQGEGHPWPLIEVHRALLLHDAGTDTESVQRHLMRAIEACSPSGTGILDYIGIVVAAVAVRLGVEPPIDLDALAGTLPARLPRGAWDVLREALAGRGQLDARSLLDRCLPFNFG